MAHDLILQYMPYVMSALFILELLNKVLYLKISKSEAKHLCQSEFIVEIWNDRFWITSRAVFLF